MSVPKPSSLSCVVTGWRHFSGYNFEDANIRAFSHTHLVGAGVNDLGNVGIMPMRLDLTGMGEMSDWSLETFGFMEEKEGGKNRTLPVEPLLWWASSDKSQESASPGLYGAYLVEPQVHADLLALSTHAGQHRYVFEAETHQEKSNAGENAPFVGQPQPTIILDACHLAKLEHPEPASCHNASITVESQCLHLDCTKRS
jgi:hypothetical protein